ncbi:sulfotransferase 1E1-like [Oppia nitens]|uniref:sulfotransferase 1E1-like n=1 Tax=Oppia nitens TaxID=1686743 RepID=UPI0023DB7A15|nr:sulfotransferase 1E1-like [Oppia nitens]
MAFISKTNSGLKFPIFYPDESIDYALRYEPKNTDIFVITYPKCGTQWCRQIVSLIVNNGVRYANDRLLDVLEYSGQEYRYDNLVIDRLTTSTVVSTHLPIQLLPYTCGSDTKYICVLRNPKDVVVAYYHQLCDQCMFAGTVHEFVDLWLDGRAPYGDYFEYCRLYWQQQYVWPTNMLCLIYEHMTYNLRPYIMKIAELLGDSYVNRLTTSEPALIDTIIEKSTTGYIRHTLSGMRLRKSIVGHWRTHLNQTDSYAIDKKVDEVWTGTGLERLWEREMKFL